VNKQGIVPDGTERWVPDEENAKMAKLYVLPVSNLLADCEFAANMQKITRILQPICCNFQQNLYS